MAYPSQEWIVQKNKKNAIKVIFTQGCQLTYRLVGEKIVRIDSLHHVVELADHVNFFKSMPIKKRSEWVFVFRTPLDLHNFISIVENVNPESLITKVQPVVTFGRSDSLERRNRDYLRRQGIEVEDEEPGIKPEKILMTEEDIKAEEINEENNRALKIQKIKEKVDAQRL